MTFRPPPLCLRRLNHFAWLALIGLVTACGGGGGGSETGSSDSGGISQAQASASAQLLRVVGASATAVERADLTAANAIDQNTGTRWSSGFSDDQSLTLDFGRSASIDSVRIHWENAHASSYLLQVSEDGSQWVSTKTVDHSAGGVEEWTGLAAQGRYLRLQGLKRSTAYGYSIYEIEVRGRQSTDTPVPPVSEDPPAAETPPASADPAPSPSVPETSAGVDYLPLFAASTPVVEQIQYSEADGTLVTYAGFRPTNRHSREGGEPWTDEVDQGPGNHWSFPTFYFQNRTYGLVIRDEVPAGRQKITVYLKPNKGVFINNGFSAFRRLDPGIIEYGWKLGVGYTNPQDGSMRCQATDKISEMCVAQSILDYWRGDDENQLIDAGVLSGPKRDKKLKLGDAIEMSPAQFLDHLDGVDKALIDGGGIRYYSFEQLYVVGKGMVPWYGAAPYLDSRPLPASALSAGQASVSYNYSEEPHRAFQQTVNNIGIANMQRFVEGRRLFHTSFLDGKHSESPDVNPVFSQHIDQLGARYNEVRCLGCHSLNGRSPVAALNARNNTMAVFTAASSSAGSSTTPDPNYGFNVQQLARSSAAADQGVSIASYQTSVRTLADGEQIELRKPVFAFKGPVPANYSVRQAPQVVGMGLLEALDEATILALADPDDRNGDGVRGVPNWAIDPETGQRHLGRFGWKAGKGSLRQQAASAFLLDMGVTTPAYKSAACQRGTSECKSSSAVPAVSAQELEQLASYLQLLGVPSQRSMVSGYTRDGNGRQIVVPPEHSNINPAQIARGSQLFVQARCTACHVAEMKTGNRHPFQELRNQLIRPYSDLLLHDMGSGLADSLAEGQARPGMWRTPPLWGLGSLKYVQGSNGVANEQAVRYLHDGRARTLMEAIAWHAGEADGSRKLFEGMSASDRKAVLDFLNSL